MKPNPKADFFFNKAKKWQEEYKELRTIILSCGLQEEVKWGVPCYTLEGKNIVLIHGFKEYCAILFHKGVLLKDPKKLLIQQTENVQGARQMRFTSLAEIVKLKTTIKAFVKAAVEIEESGEKVPMKKTAEFSMPDEFKKALSHDKNLKKAFDTLTPGRQRGYLLYFSSAKQAKTREERIEKYYDKILKGKGLDDDLKK
jgi:uncharacterized protein YdeI (YjbR/CyaY-like superfamily)